MSDAYESRKVVGWRTRAQLEAEAARRELWAVPVVSRQLKGKDKPKDSELGNHEAWFALQVGGSRAAASAKLKQLRAERQRRQYYEMTPEQRKAYNEYHRERRTKWTADQVEKYRATQQAWTEENAERVKGYKQAWKDRNADRVKMVQAIYAQLRRLSNDDDQAARELRLAKLRADGKARRLAQKSK